MFYNVLNLYVRRATIIKLYKYHLKTVGARNGDSSRSYLKNGRVSFYILNNGERK